MHVDGKKLSKRKNKDVTLTNSSFSRNISASALKIIKHPQNPNKKKKDTKEKNSVSLSPTPSSPFVMMHSESPNDLESPNSVSSVSEIV